MDPEKSKFKDKSIIEKHSVEKENDEHVQGAQKQAGIN